MNTGYDNPEVQLATPITDDIMKTNAATAAKRGAAWLDGRKPGWAVGLGTIVSDIRSADVEKVPSFPIQLGLSPNLEVMEDEAEQHRLAEENFAFFLHRDGDLAFHLEGELDIFFVLFDLGPEQADIQDAEQMIDLGYYGFLTEPSVIGLGKHSGYVVPSKERKTVLGGFCIQKAGRFLAEAWNAEIAARQGVK